MSARYHLTYEVSPDLLKRAMTSWAKPRETQWPQVKMILLMLLIGAAIGLFGNLSGLFDLVTGDFITGMLIGFYLGIVVWFFMHRRDVRRLSGFATDQLQKQGPIEAEFSINEVVMRTRLAHSVIDWQSYDQVIEMGDAVALRSGALIYAVPYSALPAGVTPAQFHMDLTTWVGAKS